MWLCFFPIEVEAFAALGDAEFVAVDAIDQRRVARPGQIRSAADAVGGPVAIRCLANYRSMAPSEVNTVYIPLKLVPI